MSSSDEDSVTDDDSVSYYLKALRMHTWRRHSYQVKSLKTISFIQIIKRRICGAGCGHGIYLANELPNSLRNGLLEFFLGSKRAIEYVHDEECLVFNLLNEDTTKVDLSNWDPSDWYSEKLEQVMEKLALHSPSLEEFACNSSDCRNREFITPPVLDNLLQLKYLTHLSMEGVWCWSNEDLVSLSQSLKKLVYLKLSLDVQVKPEVGFEYFPLLEDLRSLLFKIETATDFILDMVVYQPIYSWCTQNMPNLKEIKSGIDDFGSDVMTLISFAPTCKGTRALEILHSAHYLPQAKLPNLTHLLFAGPIGDDRTKKKFAQYQNLTNLHLENVSNEDIRDICNNVGRQLKKLIISSIFDEAVDIFLIFHLCPHLVSLRLFAVKLTLVSPFVVRIDQNSFQSLESLSVSTLEKQEYPAGLLNFLLFAPLIQKIKLGEIVIKKEDCQLFHDIAPDNFLHLTHFEMEPFVRELRDLSIVSDLGKMAMSIICAAPNLMEFDSDLSSFRNHPRIVKCWKSMKEVHEVMDIMRRKTYHSYGNDLDYFV